MNKIGEIILKVVRAVYLKAFNPYPNLLPCIEDPNEASEIIGDFLLREEPCMIARFGSVELNALSNWACISRNDVNYLKFIKGRHPQWWWNMKGLHELKQNAGFFPNTIDGVSEFCELMYNNIFQVDILGSWRPEENYFGKELKNVKLLKLHLLDPYWVEKPWTIALEGKKVLVVHPFSSIIEKQYNEKRTLLFDNKNVLPSFDLRTITAVQSIGGEDNGYKDWFEALAWMENEMDKEPYDIALIGCGAYGFPLAAYAKKTGHKAIHLGGSLQLLFGIKGMRWENPNYGVKDWGLPYGAYSKLMNEYWIRPGDILKPKDASKIEGGCYW